MTKANIGLSTKSDPVRGRPLPEIDDVSAPFWAATARGELAIQHCAKCGRYQHPPRSLCPWCGSSSRQFRRVSGEARLYSWTTSSHRILGRFDDHIPYVSVLVELIEQPGLLLASDLVGRTTPTPRLTIGRRMHVEFLATADPAVVLPQFAFPEES